MGKDSVGEERYRAQRLRGVIDEQSAIGSAAEGPRADAEVPDLDRGKELWAHAELASKTGVPVFFADPRSPWQRGTNEKTNDLLRQYFPEGTDLSRWTAKDLAAVAHTLNTRPRKVLERRTPAEAMERHLQSLQQQSVATTS